MGHHLIKKIKNLTRLVELFVIIFIKEESHMKNIILGSVFILLFLPQASFGQTDTPAVPAPAAAVSPQQAACEEQIGQENTAFWSKQGQERGDFIKSNPQSIAKHDEHFREGHDLDVAKRLGKSTAGLPTPVDDDPAFIAFQAKQQSDKVAFLAKINQDMQKCLSGTSSQ